VSQKTALKPKRTTNIVWIGLCALGKKRSKKFSYKKTAGSNESGCFFYKDFNYK